MATSKWTPQEVEALRGMLGSLPREVIAKKLGRTRAAVKYKTVEVIDENIRLKRIERMMQLSARCA